MDVFFPLCSACTATEIGLKIKRNNNARGVVHMLTVENGVHPSLWYMWARSAGIFADV